MSYNIFNALLDVLSEAENIYSSKEEQEQRLNFCYSCEKLSKIKTCKMCHCIVKEKVKFIKSECPLNKW